jgi:hypothetical protein
MDEVLKAHLWAEGQTRMGDAADAVMMPEMPKTFCAGLI